MMNTARRPIVLVLEDEWLIANEVEDALVATGYDVLGPVGRAKDALELLKSRDVDAAVLDIKLHDGRSFEVAKQLASISTPFVFLSGYTESALPENLRRRPMMHKPFEIEQLTNCVAGLIGAPRQNARCAAVISR